MKPRNIVLNLMLLPVFVLAACGGGAAPADQMMEKPTEEAMMAQPTEEAMLPHETTAPDMMEQPTAESMMDAPAWFNASLTNVHTGESFTIADLNGKVVLVETMAVWCSNCKKQQGQVKALHEMLGARDDFLSLGLDIDPNEDASQLKSFIESNGFDWHYAVASADVSREIASLYGDQFLNPPSTPMLIIDRHGEVHPLPFGIKSADELLDALKPYLEESM